MTGENFKALDRRSDKLEKMRKEYYLICEKSQEALDDGNYERYYSLHDNVIKMREDIWAEAFYHFGRNWNMANDYCKRYGV